MDSDIDCLLLQQSNHKWVFFEGKIYDSSGMWKIGWGQGPVALQTHSDSNAMVLFRELGSGLCL